MIGVDRLIQITSHLDKISNDDSRVLSELREYMSTVFDSEEYQKWLEEDQYKGDTSFSGKPPEPSEAAQKFPHLKHLLTSYALVANGRLQVKIDKHFDRIHITDGFWVPSHDRVFPTCDESELICNFVNNHIADAEGLFLIDPACGSGHHALGLKSKFRRRASLDINGRALAFARFNSVLNEDSKHLVGYSDVTDGICEEIVSMHGSHVVFTINMPFAIPPEKSQTQSFSFSQDGGDRGAALTTAALRAVRAFSDRDQNFSKLDAVVLCYSLGKPQADRCRWVWELEKYARELFLGSQVDFHLLEDQMLWRVNGKKEQPNPMPIERIVLKADCVHTFSAPQREAKKFAYTERVKEFLSDGFTHLGYGIIHIRVER